MELAGGHVAPDGCEVLPEFRVGLFSEQIGSTAGQVGLADHMAVEVPPVTFSRVRANDGVLLPEQAYEVGG